MLLLVLLASWLAPLALADSSAPGHACCRRGAHHCQSTSDLAFRDAKPHCRACQAVVTAHQAPRAAASAVGAALGDAQPLAQQPVAVVFRAASPLQRSPRAPPDGR